MSCHCCSHHAHAVSACRRHPHSFLEEYGGMLLSGLLLAAGVAFTMSDVSFFRSPGVALVWFLAAYLPVALPVLKEAWEELKHGEYFNEFTLMFIATVGAFAIGEYPEGVAVMLFYSVGEHFQEKAVSKARANISDLVDMHPEKVSVIRDGQSVDVLPERVQVGEVIEVKAGERVPLDGSLCDEMVDFNTSALTGESLPRSIAPDAEVLAGMISTNRTVRIKVSRPFNDSALSRILRMVEEASERKASAELFIRKFARIYTPAVTGLAVLIVLLPYLWAWVDGTFSYVLSDWLYRALVFLVVSCPCALVVSIPLSYFSGIGAASRSGILFKGGNYLDAITSVNTVVFDKTGTLTQGSFEVQDCQPGEGFSREELLRLVASAEQHSTHPIAKAIVDYARRWEINFFSVREIKEAAGYGLTCSLASQNIVVGNAKLLSGQCIAYPQELDNREGTLVLCAVDGRYAGYLSLSDVLKADAPDAIRALKKLNIEHIEMLSGDKQSIVTTFARKLGITQAYGDLLPEGKVRHLEDLRKNADNRIAFVGDGINDSPVLALSDVGIAMGGLGSDAAIETADVVIQTDQPSKVATAIRIGRRTRSIVWQNIVLALGVKALVLAMGALGMATLWEAVFADVGVALLAILNAMRLQKQTIDIYK